jgi:Fic family protein
MEDLKLSQNEQQILAALANYRDGVSPKNLLPATKLKITERTLQRYVAKLHKKGKIRIEGHTNKVRYFLVAEPVQAVVTALSSHGTIPLSAQAATLLGLVRRPQTDRKPVGYNRWFLDEYHPNRTVYLSIHERERLAELGKTNTSGAPAGTYARQILGRLLIDLSWNSSRLEGNTYSLLDTQLLLADGATPSEKSATETQMILNHKDAIEFIVENADGAIGFNRYTITGLHAMLSNNLLANPAASGRLRSFAVGIGNSVYTPIAIPQVIEELFGIILKKASAIENPFEQAFFALVHLPYLQPFDDVNKRVSRLAVNIPLNNHNLAPLTFTEVPQDMYTAALLAVYELNDILLLKEVFIWTYEKSAARYAAIRQTLGEPDPFRLQYRNQLRTLLKHILVNGLSPEQASIWIKTFALDIIESDRSKFIDVVDEELLSLHEGNFARYLVTPSQFSHWKQRFFKG